MPEFTQFRSSYDSGGDTIPEFTQYQTSDNQKHQYARLQQKQQFTMFDISNIDLLVAHGSILNFTAERVGSISTTLVPDFCVLGGESKRLQH